MDPNDKRGGQPFRCTQEVFQFREWYTRNQLQQIVQKGIKFTWCNNRNGSARTWEVLDRGFATTEWCQRFPLALIHTLPRHCSDHSPILLDTEVLPPRGLKPFRFERIWFEYQDFPHIVQQVWNGRNQGSPMYRLHHKLMELQKKLKVWNRERVGDINHRVAQAHQELRALEEGDQQGLPQSQVRLSIRVALNRLLALERQQEIFWAQRARVQCLRDGDRNTKFFMRKAQRRIVQNRITSILKADGTIAEGEDAVRQAVVEYFEEHWCSRIPSIKEVPPDIFNAHVTQEMATLLDILHSLRHRKGRHALLAAKLDLVFGKMSRPQKIAQLEAKLAAKFQLWKSSMLTSAGRATSKEDSGRS
ncbi:hypothetical protein QJS10_CPB18g00881 [Acorus calamus]|uniref:Reverse transcriptase n=1 Tax=Acorus calamus TaxID=4465 RepID=A0AAV9CPC9_ACOCL|nr:hypothetical protein QJS10_CPB18g00881 [Acorus calamus]